MSYCHWQSCDGPILRWNHPKVSHGIDFRGGDW